MGTDEIPTQSAPLTVLVTLLMPHKGLVLRKHYSGVVGILSCARTYIRL